MSESNFVKFQFHYILSRKIPFIEISDNIPNIRLEVEENNLTGFYITLEKSVSLDEAEHESDEYAYLFSDLISIKSKKYTMPILNDYEAYNAAGSKRIGKNLILRFDVEGAPARLKTIDKVVDILESDSPQIRTHLSYLAKAVVLQYEHFPDHSIIEAFKIIENNSSFPSYYKFFALRNELAHAPSYFPNTVKYFKECFDRNTFDYLNYDPNHNIIVLNLHSNKTQKELNKLLKELMDGISNYLRIP